MDEDGLNRNLEWCIYCLQMKLMFEINCERLFAYIVIVKKAMICFYYISQSKHEF